MEVVKYEYGSKDITWEEQTSFTQDEIRRISDSIDRIESVINNITKEDLTGELRLCTINLYKPHRLGDATFILSVPRAKTYDGGNSSDVTSKVTSSLRSRDVVYVCASKEDMKEVYQRLN